MPRNRKGAKAVEFVARHRPDFCRRGASALPQPVVARADVHHHQFRQSRRFCHTLQQVETALQQPGLSKDVLQKLQNEVAPLGPTLQRVLDHLTPHLAAQKAQLDQLGAPPAAKAPPESKEVAAERVKRQKAFDDVDSLVKRTNLLIVQVDQAQTTIASRLRARLTEALLQQEPSIASPSLWADVIREIPRNLHALRHRTSGWFGESAAKLDRMARTFVLRTAHSYRGLVLAGVAIHAASVIP